MTFDQKWGTKILIATVLFIGLYLVSSYLPFGGSRAVNADDDTTFWHNYYEALAGEQFEDAGFDDRGPGWDDVFGKTNKKNGQNLYLLIYKELKSGPANAALENTAMYFGYTKDITMDIIDGNLHDIIKYDSSVAEFDASQYDLGILDDAISMYNDISNYYDQQLALETLSSELSTKVKLQEMFANGDTSDSGFDLIVDLRIIEYILFGGVNEDGYGSRGDGGLDLGGDSGSSGGDNNEGDGVGSGTGNDEGDGEALSSPGTEDAMTPSNKVIGDKNECFKDNELNRAFTGFIDENNDGGDSGNNDAKVKVSNDGGNDTGADSSGGEGNDAGNDSSELVAPASGDWLRDLPCDSFICLEINFVSGSDEEIQYEETTNCIDCHFTYIEETLKEVTSHSLTPGKVPGNMLEDASCKEASTKVFPSITVFAIPSPILTPANDNIIIDVSGKWKNFKDALQPKREKGDEEYDPEDSTNYLSTSDEAAMLTASVKGDAVGSIGLTDEIINQSFAEFDASIETAEELSMSSQMTDMTTMFQALQYEMDSMNSMFTSILMSLSTDLEYLSQIKDKPYQK